MDEEATAGCGVVLLIVIGIMWAIIIYYGFIYDSSTKIDEKPDGIYRCKIGYNDFREFRYAEAGTVDHLLGHEINIKRDCFVAKYEEITE